MPASWTATWLTAQPPLARTAHARVARREQLRSVGVWATTEQILCARLVSCVLRERRARRMVTVLMPYVILSAIGLMAGQTVEPACVLVAPRAPLRLVVRQPVTGHSMSVLPARDAPRAPTAQVGKMEGQQRALL